ncbi:glycosyltransferase family protein [Aquibacillus koreensis]|uniref:Glycosyltransferase family protein n=1 Tax=Aquibacillus koreensis TaxID=279446 RepID=A0A9X4AJ39_9BACI|nr:glycosyltransferase family protein [Aquibacillus koreensis]MCT2536290.1 glycosyltransferase family protein [Aquibacillus koreensis]MDC3421359.1 glycosyltransferase family protein [Aquibacillus koreensis]
MKIVGIIQARMGSSRLPGKVLKQVLDKPLLSYQLERVYKSKYLNDVLVATTDNPIDNDIVSLCEKLEMPYFRGPEEDVLKRLYMAARHVDADIVVRLTGDCPIIDPVLIDKVIKVYNLDETELRYVSNTIKRTYPRGMDVEVFSVESLQEAYEKAKLKSDREHVTRYMREHPEKFSLVNISENIDYSYHRWTVDTVEDFELIKKIIEALYPQKKNFTMEDTIRLLEANPSWQRINSHIQQYKV